MAEWSGFFDAHKVGDEWDRTYLAEHYASYFASFIGNGVFAGQSAELQVVQSTPAGMSVDLSPGRCWIEGYAYINDSPLNIKLDVADGAFDRIDTIVAQWSLAGREIRGVYRKGTPGVNPTAPVRQYSTEYKELVLAEIRVKAGSTSITQSAITDTRPNSSICGWVTGLLQQVDTSTLFLQWQKAYEEAYAETEDYLEAQKRAWEEFFDSISQDFGLPVPSLETANHAVVINPEGNGYSTKNDHQVIPLTIPANWVGSQAPYTQRIAVEGILSGDYPHMTPVLDDSLELALQQEEALSLISDGTTEDGFINLRCLSDKPSIEIPVTLEVNR